MTTVDRQALGRALRIVQPAVAKTSPTPALHGVPVHRLPLAWSSTTALVQLRSWLDGLAVGTEVER